MSDNWNDPESYEIEARISGNEIAKLKQEIKELQRYKNIAVRLTRCEKYSSEGKPCCYNFKMGKINPCDNCVTRHYIKDCYVCSP
jgi:hypothetical protein